MTTPRPVNTTLEFLQTRRSVTAANMPPGGPDADSLQAILAAGIRVPDHGKLAPWRIVVFEGEARGAFGAKVLRPAFAANQRADAPETTLALEAARLNAPGSSSPCSRPRPSRTRSRYGAAALRRRRVPDPADRGPGRGLRRPVADRVDRLRPGCPRRPRTAPASTTTSRATSTSAARRPTTATDRAPTLKP